MSARVARSIVATCALLTPALAHAQPRLDEVVLDPSGIDLAAHDALRRRSYWLPVVEIVVINVGSNLAFQLSGHRWSDISFGAFEYNVSRGPVLDTDPYATNQIVHPLFGAGMYTSARSTGHGLWVSAAYAVAGSLMWELLMETDAPSVNDQITTPFGGVLIGEGLHRIARVLRSPALGPPGVARRLAAAVVDPAAWFNRTVWGEAWAPAHVPSLYAHVGTGVTWSTGWLGGADAPPQLYVDLDVEYGLTGGSELRPRQPLDHFELRGSLSVSNDVDGTLYTHGLVLGSGFGNPDRGMRGLTGVFAAYDFSNEDRVRHSVLGVGPGITSQLQHGALGYVQCSWIGYLVPWGAAGGENELSERARDYHRGPGLAARGELKVGWKTRGELRVTSRLYGIAGTTIHDRADELVSKTTVGARVALAPHHEIVAEGDFDYRHVSYDRENGDSIPRSDRETSVRVFYALSTDGLLR